MKLDTSSYYPESLLEEEVDEKEEMTVDPQNDRTEEKDNKEEKKNEPEVSSLPSASERFADGSATFLSWALVPLLMPVYGVLLAFNLSILDFTPYSVKLVFTLVTLAFTVAVPALLVLLLKRMGLVTDFGLNGRKERVIPYIISILCLAAAGVFMWYKGAPMWLVMFFGGGAVAGAINLLINFRWKISAHAAGVAGVVALLIRIIRDGLPQDGAFLWLLIAIGLSGILGTARVWLGRHTAWQVIAGYAVGFLSVILMTLL